MSKFTMTLPSYVRCRTSDNRGVKIDGLKLGVRVFAEVDITTRSTLNLDGDLLIYEGSIISIHLDENEEVYTVRFVKGDIEVTSVYYGYDCDRYYSIKEILV